jgi:hypothetical protein
MVQKRPSDGSSHNPVGPSHKAAARFGSRSHSLLGAPRKWGKKKEKIQLCLTYMLRGIGRGCSSPALRRPWCPEAVHEDRQLFAGPDAVA